MKLDKTFAKEIKKAANGDGSREAKFAFLNPAREAAKKLSTPDVAGTFNNVVKEYGRVAVGICVAVTIWERRDRLNAKPVEWARAVLDLWTNRPIDITCLNIADNLHPTRIEDYADGFIKCTTEEW